MYVYGWIDADADALSCTDDVRRENSEEGKKK